MKEAHKISVDLDIVERPGALVDDIEHHLHRLAGHGRVVELRRGLVGERRNRRF
jgi:hypothetical protein